MSKPEDIFINGRSHNDWLPKEVPDNLLHELPAGKSIWVISPKITIFELRPNLVTNIFICIFVVFCASSKMIKAFSNVLPLIKAKGAISITPLSILLSNIFLGMRSFKASYKGLR